VNHPRRDLAKVVQSPKTVSVIEKRVRLIEFHYLHVSKIAMPSYKGKKRKLSTDHISRARYGCKLPLKGLGKGGPKSKNRKCNQKTILSNQNLLFTY
jgi:hypothetical protein